MQNFTSTTLCYLYSCIISFFTLFFSASQDDVKNNIEIMSVGGLQLVKLTINPLWEASFFFTMAMLALSGSYRYRLRRLQPFWCAIIICSFIVCISQVCESTPVLSPPKTRVFGPGIHAKRSALPVNYFYIQAVDSAGKSKVLMHCTVHSRIHCQR